MKKALINDTSIIEIRGDEFEVHPSLVWVDVADNTTTQDSYVDGQIVKYVPSIPTKDQHKAAILNALPGSPDRLTVQLTIQLGELTASVQAPAYGMTVPQAIAYAYAKNPAYRRAKDAEAACLAIDAEVA